MASYPTKKPPFHTTPSPTCGAGDSEYSPALSRHRHRHAQASKDGDAVQNEALGPGAQAAVVAGEQLEQPAKGDGKLKIVMQLRIKRWAQAAVVSREQLEQPGKREWGDKVHKSAN